MPDEEREHGHRDRDPQGSVAEFGVGPHERRRGDAALEPFAGLSRDRDQDHDEDRQDRVRSGEPITSSSPVEVKKSERSSCTPRPDAQSATTRVPRAAPRGGRYAWWRISGLLAARAAPAGGEGRVAVVAEGAGRGRRPIFVVGEQDAVRQVSGRESAVSVSSWWSGFRRVVRVRA